MDAKYLTWGVPNARWSEAHSKTTWPRGFLNRYDLEEVIGHGASSEVFGATVRATGDSVAVKRVFKKRCCVGARATRRLRDEVRVLSKLKHERVVEMREVWETPTELYIVMERAHGGELFDRIVDRGNFTELEAKTVMRQLLSALSEMHRRGVIHRDVKPENLLLTTKEGWDIKLSDFGLVKTLEDDDTTTPLERQQPLQQQPLQQQQPRGCRSSGPRRAPRSAAPAAELSLQEKKNKGVASLGMITTPELLPTVSPGDQTVQLLQPQHTADMMMPSPLVLPCAAASPSPQRPLNATSKRRPSWGDALETVDEKRPAHYTHTNEISQGGGLALASATARYDAASASAIASYEAASASYDAASASTSTSTRYDDDASPFAAAEKENGVNYYYSTAGVDLQLNGGFGVEVTGPLPELSPSGVNLGGFRVDGTLPAEEPSSLTTKKASLAPAPGESKMHSYALSEEEAWALLPALGPPPTGGESNERDVELMFRSARTHTLCGSPFYMAPEVCDRERYGPAVDVWSAGVVMYILLTGSPPWDRPPQFRSPPPLDMHELSQVSRLGVDLLLLMLKAIPDERCTAAEALNHPWLRETTPTNAWALSSSEDNNASLVTGLSPRFESAIRNFCAKRKRTQNGSLDMTPVARALEPPLVNVFQYQQPPHAVGRAVPTATATRGTPPTADTVHHKRNRQASPSRQRRQHHRPVHQDDEYDTYSSGGSDDDDDDDDASSPALEPLHELPYHSTFRLSLDAEPVAVQGAATW